MPTVSVSWTMNAADLTLLGKHLTRRINTIDGTNHVQPSTVAQLETILKPHLTTYLKRLAKEQDVTDTLNAVRSDAENEIDAIRIT